VETFEKEAEELVHPDGTFRITGLKPGSKMAALWWKDRSGFHFQEFRCTIHPDAETYVGPIRAAEGAVVRGLVKAVGREQLPEPLRKAPIPVTLSFASRPFGGTRPFFTRTLPVEADQPFVLSGLCLGKLWGEAVVADATPGIRWRKGFFALDVPEEADFIAEVTADRLKDTQLRVTFGAGLRPGPVNLHILRESETSEPTLVLNGLLPKGDTVERTLPLPEGIRLIWAFMALERLTGEGQNGFGEVRIPEGASRAELVLSPGAILRGRLLSRGGAPFQTNLGVYGEPFMGPEQPFLREVVADEFGRFVMPGLPPGKELYYWRVRTEIPPLVAGSETVLDLVMEN
jgi:hypothetical protein